MNCDYGLVTLQWCSLCLVLSASISVVVQAMGKVDWGMQSRVLIARAKLYRSNGNTPLAVEVPKLEHLDYSRNTVSFYVDILNSCVTQDLNRCQSECCSCLTPYTMLAEWSLADGDSIAALCHANQGLGAYLALGRPVRHVQMRCLCVILTT